MKPVTMVFLVTLLVLSGLAGPGMADRAQTESSTTFSLPINLRILRIRAGTGFEYGTDASGSIAYQNQYILNDGLVAADIPTALQARYDQLGVQDLYLSRAGLVPESASLAMPVVVVETGIATFPDADTAKQFVTEDVGLRQGRARGISPLPDLPEHDGAIVGMSGQGDQGRQGHPDRSGQRHVHHAFVRFAAQYDTLAVSVEVASADASFNEAIARELLSAQLDCLEQDDMCVPVPLPGSVAFEPGTPMASPVATSPDRRLVTARSRA